MKHNCPQAIFKLYKIRLHTHTDTHTHSTQNTKVSPQQKLWTYSSPLKVSLCSFVISPSCLPCCPLCSESRRSVFCYYKLVCIVYMDFGDGVSCFFHSELFWDSSTLFHVSVVPSYLLLSSIPRFGYAAVCWVIHLSMAIGSPPPPVWSYYKWSFMS